MSKDKTFREFEQSMGKIQERKRQIEREEKQIIVRCAHQNNGRKLKIRPISDHGDFRCKECGTEFNMTQIPQADLKKAVSILHDALQQIRCFANPEAEAKTIRFLGELDFNNEEIIQLYSRTLDAFSKNKKKDKFADRGDNFGSYGAGGFSFIGDPKKRRK